MQKYYLKFHTALVILNIASVTSEEELLPHIAKSAVRFLLTLLGLGIRRIPHQTRPENLSQLRLVQTGQIPLQRQGQGDVPESRVSPHGSFHSYFSLTLQSVLGGIRIEDMSMMFESDSVPFSPPSFLPDHPDFHSHLPRHRLLLLPAPFLPPRRPRRRPSRLGPLSPPRAPAAHLGRRQPRAPPARTLLLSLSSRTAWVPRRCTTSASAASTICPAWPPRPPRW